MAGVGAGRRPMSMGEAIAAAGGALLFVFLFLPWFGASSGFGADGETANAWEVYSLADIVLALIALATVALAAIGFLGANVRLPVARIRLMKWLAAVALTIVLLTAIELSTGDPGKLFDIKVGAILAALSAIAMLAGAILAERPELAPRLGAGGAPARAGEPYRAGPGGVGQPQQPPAGGGLGAPAGGGATTVGTVQPEPPTQPQPSAQPVSPPQPTSPPPPPGGRADWYPDPRGEKRLRYWDGAQWTQHTAD